MAIQNNNDAILAEVKAKIESLGFEADMFTVRNMNTKREFGKVGRVHCEIKLQHYMFECFRGSDYAVVNVTIWNYLRLNNRYIGVELIKQECETRPANDTDAKILDWK